MHSKRGLSVPYMVSGSEALGWRNGFRAFHRAEMSSQDIHAYTVGCIFLHKTQLNTLKPYTESDHNYVP